MNDITILNGSDPAGKIILSKDKVYRGINKDFVIEYTMIYYNCLQNDLFGRYIINTKIADDFKLDPFFLIFEHEKVKPYTYPFEWTLLMAIDSAYTTLNLVASLDKIGLGLKDGHRFNIAYHKGNFHWIDFGSIIQYKTFSWMFEEFMDAFINAIICMANGTYHSDNVTSYLTDTDEKKYTHLRTKVLMYAHEGAVAEAAQLLYQWIHFYERKIKIVSHHSSIPEAVLSPLLHFAKDFQIKDILLISGDLSTICFPLAQNNLSVTVFHENAECVDFLYSQIKGKTISITPVYIDFLNPNSKNNEPRWLKAEERFATEMVVVFQHFTTINPIDFAPLVKKLKAFTLRYAALEVTYPYNTAMITAIEQEFDIMSISTKFYHQNKKLLFVKAK